MNDTAPAAEKAAKPKIKAAAARPSKPRRLSREVGEAMEVDEGAIVDRPDGSQHRISGGLYVLDVPGVHVVDGREVDVT